MTKAKTNTLDLADLDTAKASDKGYRLELLHPTNAKPLGVFITVLGKHSEVFREHIRETVDDRMRREAIADRRNKPSEVPTMEAAERKALELLVICTIGWENMVYEGEELPFNASNALKIYTKLLWVREQVDNAIGDLENFI